MWNERSSPSTESETDDIFGFRTLRRLVIFVANVFQGLSWVSDRWFELSRSGCSEPRSSDRMVIGADRSAGRRQTVFWPLFHSKESNP